MEKSLPTHWPPWFAVLRQMEMSQDCSTRDGDKSLLNDCDGYRVQEEHEWINVHSALVTVGLHSEPADMSPHDIVSSCYLILDIFH